MDIKLNRKAHEGAWVVWKHKGQEARILLKPLSRRASRTVLAGTVDVKSRKPLPNMRRFFEESIEAQIIDWQNIRVDAEDGNGPASFPCTPENKRMLLEFDPFYDFIEEELGKLKSANGARKGQAEKN